MGQGCGLSPLSQHLRLVRRTLGGQCSGMWIGVTPRFTTFLEFLLLTDAQISDGLQKQLGVRKCLHRHYWADDDTNPLGFLAGSWGKNTAIRPPTDIDIFMPLPISEYSRFSAYTGNGQSALLQEVKDVLTTSYAQTTMRGDGQVVVVSFNTITIELIPSFKKDDSGNWLIPDANGGGSWRTVNPEREKTRLSAVDSIAASNVRPFVRMIKCWRDFCSVPLKSFVIELLVSEFLTNYRYRHQSFYFYDWFCRDFFAYLITKANSSVIAPNNFETVLLGNDWLSRVETAYARSLKACDYEYADWTALAGEEWQKIFGGRIPVVVPI